MQLAHYDAAQKFAKLHLWLGLPVIVLSTVVGTSVFASLQTSVADNASAWLRITVGLLSVGSAVLASLQTFLRYPELAEKHRIAGAQFANLKHQIELLATLPPDEPDQVRQALIEVEQRLSKLREESPGIPEKMWAKIEQSLTYESHAMRYPGFGARLRT